jgi:hypothetical protein
VVKQGDLLEVTYVSSKPAPRRPGKRKTVTDFSNAARLRMLKRMATVHWESVGPSLFVTLTYPDECAVTTKEQRTRQRSRLLRDMENYLGKEFGALWRIEWQVRKSGSLMGTMVPHVHLIVFGLRFIPYPVVNKLWRVVLGAVGALRTDVRRIKGQRDVARYVAKYAAKVNPDRSLVIPSYLNIEGRHWGIHRPDLIPWCVRGFDLRYTPDEIELLENAAASKIPYFNKGTRTGFSLFGPVVKKVSEEIHLRRLDKLGLSG